MTPILESKRYYAAICIAALSLAMAPRASADEIYAFAGNVLTNFQIQSAPGTVIAVTGTRNTFNSAQYGITSDSTQAPEVIPAGSDASQAAVGSGPFPGEDVFTVFEGQGSLNGARADSQTLSGNPFTGDGGSSSPFVANVAEAEIPGGVGSPAATSSAANTANATFTVTVPTTITFAFTDAIALQADTGALGDSANASIANSFEIATLSGTQVFLYTPTTCGTGNLQGSVGSSGGVPLQNTLDTSCTVSGTSTLLAPGQYEVSLRTTSQVTVASGAVVTPEPASLLLFGAGLAGLFLFRRQSRT